MNIKKELYLMLKEGWSFYRACYRLGITPKEGSELFKHKTRKRKKENEVTISYTWCGNFQCRYCSDNTCTLRKEEME